MEVNSIEWWLEELGHFLWSGFHTWIQISYHRRHHATEFEIWRWKDERIIWLRVILFSVFCWEGLELLHDASGFSSTFAQLSDGDTMVDILLSGLVAPKTVISFWRWRDNISLLFTDPQIREADEKDIHIAFEAICRMAERNVGREAYILRNMRELIKREWLDNHRVRPIIKNLYKIIVRGSRRERRKRRMLANHANQQI